MKKIDKIEHIFNDRFGPGSVTNEGWNDPSDAIWDRIENNIDKDDKRRFGYLPFMLISLLAMSILWIANLYDQNTKLQDSLHDANYKLKEIQASNIKDNEAELSSKIVAKDVEDKVNVVSEQAPISLVKDEEVEDAEKVFDIVTSQTELNNQNAQFPDVSIALEKEAVYSENVNGIIGGEKSSADRVIAISEIEKSRFVQDIKALQINQSFVSISKQELLPKQISVVKDKSSGDKRISVQPFVFMNMLQTVGSQETNLSELIDSENGSEGFGMDFLISLPLKGPFEFSTGLGFESFSFITEYDIVLPYNPDEETVVNDDGYIDFEHSLPTAFGNTETALRLSRKRSSQNTKETAVGLDFNTRHRFEAVSVPLNLSFRPGAENSSFGIGISLRPTYIFNAQSGIHSVVSHHSDIDAVNNVSFSEYADLRRFNLGVGVNLSYNLDLSERAGINITAGYQDFLFNFYQTENYSSSVHRLNLSAGYFYRI